MADEAAGTGEHGAHLGGGVSLVQILQHLHHRDGAETGGGEGAVAARALGAVHHAPGLMGGDGDAAVHMADDQVQILVALAQLFRVNGGNALLVQHMGLGTAVKPRNAGQTGIIPQLVYVGGVHGVHWLAVLAAQLVGQHDAQLCRVVAAALVGGGVLYQPLVDLHDSGSLRIGAAAPADEYIHVGGGHAVGLQKGKQYLLAHGHLVVGGGVFQQLRGIVEDALGVDVLLVFKVADLGGGGSGIDDQHFYGGVHGDNLLCVNRQVPFFFYHTTFFGKKKEAGFIFPPGRVTGALLTKRGTRLKSNLRNAPFRKP